MSTAQGGSAWQAGVAEGGVEGSWPGGGRAAGEGTAEVEVEVEAEEAAASLEVLPGARNEA